MTQPSLGAMPLDLPKLLESRLLLVAGSGSGKSYALRRVLEQTATHVQQLVIDPDGEFASLRERYDYIICAPSGADAVATPATAAALAAALWKAGTSAVLDISDLAPHDRIVFVRRFFETLIAQPRPTWHSCLVALDEAQLFAPQIGDAESSRAVIDMASRGRKRGICLLPATQRIAKLSKDVAAEMRNKLIGGMSLDIDLARAGDELGFSAKDRAVLRTLEPGEFFAYGPALCREVTRTRIGPVQTTHPQLGQRIAVPPPPSSKILAQLGKLEGLQLEAAAELATIDELKAELAKLRKSAGSPPAAGVSEAEVLRRIGQAVAAERALSKHEVEKLTASLAKILAAARHALGESADAVTRSGAEYVALDVVKYTLPTPQLSRRGARSTEQEKGYPMTNPESEPAEDQMSTTDTERAKRRTELRELAARVEKFYADGCPIEDPHDTYPNDLWPAYTQPKQVVALLDELDAAASELATLRADAERVRDQTLELAALIAERTYEGSSYAGYSDAGYDYHGENSAAAIRAYIGQARKAAAALAPKAEL